MLMSRHHCQCDPGDTVRLCTGIYAKRRRMVDGKRKTAMFKIGEPTADEKRKMMKLAIAKDSVAFTSLITAICERYKRENRNQRVQS